ncbi:T9SS type A sorting domain-containing protein [Hymenobacter psychrophilus]|uniref:Por secretion system C-terminal sorting domain-containing protein n=1 Tax=Hymenobacter psychrophilus TaxID=651662 RepID=A0A1H3LUL2_9BACT|nr:T9SS type A sorting domain-containing protein [Hymenobacter psychrophilus]SDY68102.1 Por secretion system C-terminal sorting domain-containing protein [Hymenobacter psychrophilus]
MIFHYLLLIGGLVVVSAGATPACAQSGIISAGGSASSPAGSVSYSVGQLTTAEGRSPAGTSSPGNQQPLEIYVVTATHGAQLKVAALVYPNPTTDGLTLLLDGKYAGLSWYLQDASGRPLQSKRVQAAQTNISLQGLSAGMYLLSVRGKDQQVKTFKLIKH